MTRDFSAEMAVELAGAVTRAHRDIYAAQLRMFDKHIEDSNSYALAWESLGKLEKAQQYRDYTDVVVPLREHLRGEVARLNHLLAEQASTR